MSSARPTDRPVATVVLAAGASRRFADPRPKQLVPVDGEPMVRRALRLALDAGLGPVVLVLGHRADEVSEACRGLERGPWEEVINIRWHEGQSTSVRAGIEALEAHRPSPAAALFLPCDQPALESKLLADLAAAWAGGPGTIAVPRADGRRGAPVLFDRRHFPALRKLEGDQGGRQLLAAHDSEIVTVETNSRQLMDIDTLADLERFGLLPPREPEPAP